MRTMKWLIILLLLLPGSLQAARIKDIARLEGVRYNQLVGYGLVVGLNGTGDSKSTQFTTQSLVNMLERMGVTVDRSKVKVDNVAAVTVTSELPPFTKPGNEIDVTISSIGDAESIAGGTLLMTPLKGPDGKVYAVAQGPVVVGALSFGGKAAKVQKNHPTAGRIPGGALVEREIPFHLPSSDKLTYRVEETDFATVSRIADAINHRFGPNTSRPVDGASVAIRVPDDYRGRMVKFLSEVEALDVRTDSPARIVVNEKTGTIVMGQEVRIDTVAVSHGNLSLVITESADVSQPAPFARRGRTVAVPKTDIEVNEEDGELVVMNMGVSISEIAQALNAIGASPRDLIAILQAIKAAGALHAELVVL
ncbi:flagellar biosynthesis protein FlgA [Geothermobacter hydrogeniphilus]|uniref:Flagellar P-ring protein n=1 Tax=Geothermobacter hydrogeniphilus TaxID=1969733 RepID=A0A2K2HCY7_9BACT|nr:flagellar basal body P-ring protein FlgI [Geothermobacter hydrogeniphilus]PNU21144.1 flagellar biosynthesis protein FlgA [Geothermobacter hydrogeniphilus]